MAIVNLFLQPGEAHPLASAFPAYTKINGSNFPVSGLAFDAASDEAAFWAFLIDNYGSGDLTVDIFWYADTASSGDVIWDVSISAITPDDDTQDIETDGLATIQSVTDTHLGTTGQRLHKATIIVINLDSLAVGDFITLRLNRDANNGSDTMSGDAIVVGVRVSYSNT